MATSFPNLPECIGHIFDCNSTVATCYNSAQFDFSSLWTITEQYAAQCPNGPWLFKAADAAVPILAGTIALTNNICQDLAGSGATNYPTGAVWQRLTMWKFPLFQLIANAPRSPLGWLAGAFSVLHLLGDPIGNIRHLLHKIHECQSRAVFWQDAFAAELDPLCNERPDVDYRRLWKSLALIVDSFDEWGFVVGDQVQAHLFRELSYVCSSETPSKLRQEYLDIILHTSDGLAANRSTRFVPVVIAQLFFVGSVVIAMIHTSYGSQASPPTAWINIEMYSIAFTAQYFWVVFAVFCSSIIGTSQTSTSLPRILNRMKSELRQKTSDCDWSVPLRIELLDDQQRIYTGGLYSWQPAKRKTFEEHNSALEHLVRRNPLHKPTLLERLVLATVLPSWRIIRLLLPVSIVVAAAGTGQWISALVAPVGWSCRSGAMMWMFIVWLINWMLNPSLVGRSRRRQFWFAFTKDFFATAVNFGIVIVTQIGIFNRCDCYTHGGKVGLQLPSMPFVSNLLTSRLNGAFPAIVSVGIALQILLAPALLIWRYHAAISVFLQRDDGESNFEEWHNFCAWSRQKYAAIKMRRRSLPGDKEIETKDEESGGGTVEFVEFVEFVATPKK